MKVVKAFIVKFALLFCSLLLAKCNEGSQKAQKLREMVAKEPLIRLNKTGYDYYVNQYPRPYDIVVFFTAEGCKYCDEIQNEFLKAAQFYYAANAHYPQVESEKSLKSVFFARFTYNEQSQSIYQDMKFNSVPNIVVFPTKITRFTNAEERHVYLRKYTWMISYTDGHVTSHKILEFLNKRTLRNIVYKESIINLIFVAAVFGLIAMSGFFIFQKFKAVFLNNNVQFVVSMAIYAICMAGVVYNIIHNVPWTGGTDQNGELKWIENEGRGQFGMEGFLMSMCSNFNRNDYKNLNFFNENLVSLVGLLFILMYWVNKNVESKSQVVGTSVFIIVLSFFLIQFIEEIYKKKSWYQTNFWPPEHYIKGPLSKDQGNSL